MPKKGQRLPWRLLFVWVGSGIKGANAHDSEEDATKAALDMFRTARLRESELEITIENRDTGEKIHMATNDALTAEIKANVERARSYAVNGAEAGVIADLVAETEGLLKGLKGAGSVKLRNALREELTDALKATPEAEGAEEPAGAIEGDVIPSHVAALIDKGAETALEAITLGAKMAEVAEAVSQIQLAMRKESVHKSGLPDLLAGGKKTRDRAGDIYRRVAAQLNPDDVDRADALKSLQRSVQNKNSDVLVSYLRGLDADKGAGLEEARRYFPDAAAKYLKAKEKETGKKPASLTEAVYALYATNGMELPRKGRTELERERRAQGKELESSTKDDDSKLTPEVRLENYFTTIMGELDKAQKNAAKLNGTQKRKVRNRLTALAARAQELADSI
ncbi:hypothetical protein OG875_13900 [Streptomyces sp. NBC_01498]|uniref:hypothetical protein n=1 Tax=Streptomyces sp. NBC_01498 TaxID=2975870 RepID=UPI002E7B0989|nr:hypothetical protein [Streptomyces sp. NBC_01498]WTL25594.1 hypothetical protein OG875_13900 [Streptomyces sp. NBC_01498]